MVGNVREDWKRQDTTDGHDGIEETKGRVRGLVEVASPNLFDGQSFVCEHSTFKTQHTGRVWRPFIIEPSYPFVADVITTKRRQM